MIFAIAMNLVVAMIMKMKLNGHGEDGHLEK